MLTLPFVAAKIVLEGYPPPLVLLVFAFLVATLFAFVVVVGAYLRVVPPRQATAPAWLLAAVLAATAGAVAFAFHDSLLVHQTVAGLSVLYFGTAITAGTLSLGVRTVWQRPRQPHTG